MYTLRYLPYTARAGKVGSVKLIQRGRNPAGKRGRPATGSDKVVPVRLTARHPQALARFRSRDDPEMTVSEALRGALEIGMQTRTTEIFDAKTRRSYYRKKVDRWGYTFEERAQADAAR